MDYNVDDDSRTEPQIDETDNDLCRALWIAVAVQALIDASSKSKKKSAIKAKSQALKWLHEAGDEKGDFSMTCNLAGIDCGKLIQKFEQALRDPEMSVDFRCLKKAGIGNRGNESRKRYFSRIRSNKRRKERAYGGERGQTPGGEFMERPHSNVSHSRLSGTEGVS